MCSNKCVDCNKNSVNVIICVTVNVPILTSVVYVAVNTRHVSNFKICNLVYNNQTIWLMRINTIHSGI